MLKLFPARNNSPSVKKLLKVVARKRQLLRDCARYLSTIAQDLMSQAMLHVRYLQRLDESEVVELNFPRKPIAILGHRMFVMVRETNLTATASDNGGRWGHSAIIDICKNWTTMLETYPCWFISQVVPVPSSTIVEANTAGTSDAMKVPRLL